MISKNFSYQGFTVKVLVHELFPGYSLSGLNLGWYASSVVISHGNNSNHHYHEESLHPGRISVTPERAIDYGKKYAMHVINEEILYTNLSKFLETRPI